MADNNRFGQLLRTYRLQSIDPKYAQQAKPLTQARLVEKLERETGIAYTLSTISNWERGRSQVHQDDRVVLVGLVKVLYECGGIKTLPEANAWLEIGNYRALDAQERRQIAAAWAAETAQPSDPKPPASPTTLPLDTIPAPGFLPPCSYLPLRPNPFFVGRENSLKQIAAIIKAGGIVPTVIITGLGGIGKTQLAVEFGHRYGAYFPGGVFWLRFADANGIATEIAICGGADGLNLRPDFNELPLAEQVKLVRRAWREPTPRLLIFDDCPHEDLLAQYCPATGGCAVLVTSRQGHWSPAMGVTPLPLQGFSRKESITLLRQFLPEIYEDEAQAVAAELGDLPLALHLAGHFMAQYRHIVTPTTYLQQLRQEAYLQHPSLMGRGILHLPTEHEKHIGRTFSMSYTQLDPAQKIDQLARQLLARAACLAPGEPIPRPLLLATLNLPADEMEGTLLAEDSLYRLIALGLLEEKAAGFLWLHQLLAIFVKSVTHSQVAQTAVSTALITTLSQEIDESGYLGPLQFLAVHLRAAAQAAQARTDETAASLCHLLGLHLRDVGEYTTALPYLEQALTIRQQLLGRDHPHTAQSLNDLGWLYYRTGKLATAHHYLQQSLTIRETILGPHHPDTAQSLNNLGWLLWKEGDLAGAKPLLEQALRIREQSLGGHHPETARSLNSLAGLLWAQGAYATAGKLLQRALSIREQKLGPDHPRTADLLNNFGLLLKTQGDYQTAQVYLERALNIREQTLGPQHLHVAYSLSNLGVLLHLQGHEAEALPLLSRALKIRQQKLEPDHPDIAFSLDKLGHLYLCLGDLKQGRAYLENALTIREQHLGPDHPDTAESLHHLGHLWGQSGQLTQAYAYVEKALAIQKKVFGTRHPVIAHTLNSLGQLQQASGQFRQAQATYQQVLTMREELLGLTHPDTGWSLYHLGTLFQAQGDEAEAAGYYHHALTILYQTFAADHPHLKTLRQNLAAVSHHKEEA